jgi:hypothetical protein
MYFHHSPLLLPPPSLAVLWLSRLPVVGAVCTFAWMRICVWEERWRGVCKRALVVDGRLRWESQTEKAEHFAECNQHITLGKDGDGCVALYDPLFPRVCTMEGRQPTLAQQTL